MIAGSQIDKNKFKAKFVLQLILKCKEINKML